MSNKNVITNDIMIADVCLRIKTMEKILVDKGIFTREEYNKEMEGITAEISNVILEKANKANDLPK